VDQERELTKVQRNELYKSVEEGGLDVAQCELTRTYHPPSSRTIPGRSVLGIPIQKDIVVSTDAERIFQIKHLPSGSTFNIQLRWYNLDRYSYDSEIAHEEGPEGASDWRGIIRSVQKWAEKVRRECVDPDFWEELQRGATFLASAQNENLANTPFSYNEQQYIIRQLEGIKEYLKEADSLSREQATHVDERFDDIIDATCRMGRKDWLLMFGGALFSLLLAAVVSPEAVQHILSMATQGIGHLFSRGPQSLPGLPRHP
jgi:hypothetical protein